MGPKRIDDWRGKKRNLHLGLYDLQPERPMTRQFRVLKSGDTAGKEKYNLMECKKFLHLWSWPKDNGPLSLLTKKKVKESGMDCMFSWRYCQRVPYLCKGLKTKKGRGIDNTFIFPRSRIGREAATLTTLPKCKQDAR